MALYKNEEKKFLIVFSSLFTGKKKTLWGKESWVKLLNKLSFSGGGGGNTDSHLVSIT